MKRNKLFAALFLTAISLSITSSAFAQVEEEEEVVSARPNPATFSSLAYGGRPGGVGGGVTSKNLQVKDVLDLLDATGGVRREQLNSMFSADAFGLNFEELKADANTFE